MTLSVEEPEAPTVIHPLEVISQEKPNLLLSAALHLSLQDVIVLIHLTDVKTGN